MRTTDKSGIVLIVDDNPTNLKILVDTLSEEGLNVSIAKSGEQALHAIEKITPDIILLDVLMPGIDGFETCRRLKARSCCTRSRALMDAPTI